MSKAKTVHEELKRLRQNYLISKDGHNARIKESRKLIKAEKKSIKMHRLLIKQSKTAFKLEILSVS